MASPLDRLKSQLLTSGIQQDNFALFQVISQLIDFLRTEITSTQAAISGGGSGGLVGASYLTKDIEGGLPHSRQEIAGAGIEFNDSPNYRRVISTALPHVVDGEPGEDGFSNLPGIQISPGGGPSSLSVVVSNVPGIDGNDGEDGFSGILQGLQLSSSSGVSPSLSQMIPGIDGIDGEAIESFIPGPQGLIGAIGLMGPPGMDGGDGENEIIFHVPDTSKFALLSDLATHAALTTTAHGLGASAFHADDFFAPAAGVNTIVTVGTITTGAWNAGGIISSGSVTANAGRFYSSPATPTAYALYSAINTGGIGYIGLDNSTGGLTGTAYALIFYHNSPYPIIFATDSTERMRILSDGKVGIGNATPLRMLHVGPGADAPFLLYDGIIVEMGDACQITARDFVDNIEIGMVAHPGGVGGYMGTWTNHTLTLRTNNRDRLIIDAAGLGAFAAGDKYLIVDASGNLHVSALGPAS